jgi:hypothetical protein
MNTPPTPDTDFMDALESSLHKFMQAVEAQRQVAARDRQMLAYFIVSDVETFGTPVHLAEGARPWYDTAPMFDVREHSPEIIEQADYCIQRGLELGVLQRHPTRQDLLRTAPAAWPCHMQDGAP